MTGCLLISVLLCERSRALEHAVRTPPNTRQDPISGCPGSKIYGQGLNNIRDTMNLQDDNITIDFRIALQRKQQ